MNAGYGALRCYWLNGGCPGAQEGNCFPFDVWSKLDSGDTYLAGQLMSGTFRYSDYFKYTYAFSVRCVLDLIY